MSENPGLDLRVRVSYLAEGPQAVDARPAADGAAVTIESPRAAKHVRVVARGGRPAPGAVHLTWASRLVGGTPFDLPVEQGLHIDALPQDEPAWAAVEAWLAKCGCLGLQRPIKAANWDALFSPERPHFACLRQYGLADPEAATTIRVSWGQPPRLPDQAEDDLVIEAFYDWDQRADLVERVGAVTEVGVLHVDDASDVADELVQGRVRTLQKRELSKPIMFHHVPVYRVLAAPATRAVVRFSEPLGLHFSMNIDIDTSALETLEATALAQGSAANFDACALYAKLDLPSNIFIDRYQLQDLPRLTPPGELLGLWGETHLEAPEWLTDQGSQALLRLGGPEPGLNKSGDYEIPLHFRYVLPSDTLRQEGTVQPPLVFWACQEAVPLEHIPGLSFESVFPKDTVFYIHETNSIDYSIPTISAKDESTVYTITAWVIALGGIAVLLTTLKKLFSNAERTDSKAFAGKSASEAQAELGPLTSAPASGADAASKLRPRKPAASYN